jgi:hypothetical protein
MRRVPLWVMLTLAASACGTGAATHSTGSAAGRPTHAAAIKPHPRLRLVLHHLTPAELRQFGRDDPRGTSRTCTAVQFSNGKIGVRCSQRKAVAQPPPKHATLRAILPLTQPATHQADLLTFARGRRKCFDVQLTDEQLRDGVPLECTPFDACRNVCVQTLTEGPVRVLVIVTPADTASIKIVRASGAPRNYRNASELFGQWRVLIVDDVGKPRPTYVVATSPRGVAKRYFP